MMKVISGLLMHHSVGSNCGTNATKIVLSYWGYKLSERMVFGLGSGLGFIYHYYKDENSYFVSGKNESLENNISALLGGTCISGYFDDSEKAWNEVKKYIDDGYPVILDTSIRYLPYFEPYLSSITNIGFGLHNVVIAGYDAENQTVMLLDHRWTDPKIISLSSLIKARGADDSSMKPKNGYKVVIPANYSKTPLDEEIKFSIILNINRMRYPFAYKMGLKGISIFKREILKMYESFEDNKRHLTVCGTLMEKLGTGGGNYRRMYGNFLKESGTILNNQTLTNIGLTPQPANPHEY